MDLGLRSKVCLITGASAGSGWATARYLAKEGATVAITARREDKLENLADEIEAEGGQRPVIVPGDIMDAKAINAIVEQVTAKTGPVDILVNCAGASAPIVDREETDELWLDAMTLNFHSARRFTTAVLPGMKDKRWGRVVNFSGSMEPRFQNAALPAKAAIHLWAKGLSCEVAPFGITINTIAPGRIATEQIMERIYPTEESRDAFITENIPMGYFGDPNEIAWSVAFLVSERASYITGVVLPVDGGMKRVGS